MLLFTTYTKRFLLFVTILLAGQFVQAQDFFWVGGSGNWNDLSHWSKMSGDPSTPTGVLPNRDSKVIIDNQSGPAGGFTIVLAPGDYEVRNLLWTNENFATLSFMGTNNSNQVRFSVFGDLSLNSRMNITYPASENFDNFWIFEGPDIHNVITAGKDLLNVEIHDEGGTFNQLDPLLGSKQIRMFAGKWDTNGHDISTNGRLWFKDSNTSSNPLTKQFNSDGSNIYAFEWASGFTYGEFSITGNQRIFVSKFRGSPTNGFEPPIRFNEIHLLEYSDTPSGGAVIEYNNFECENCEIETLIVEDTGDTKFANSFTVNQEFTVANEGSRIYFNSGNTRGNEVTINGSVNTPPAQACSERTLFSTIHTDFTKFIRNSGTLSISDADLNNIGAEGNANFNLSNGSLQGASTGWTLINAPTATAYYWVGISGANGNWDDPNNWVLEDGNGNGCIPSATDNVFVNSRANGNIRIQSPYLARCNNFTWTNNVGLELILDGQSFAESALEIRGSLDLNSSATISPVGNHEIYFSSATPNNIKTSGVHLPEIWFTGDIATWNLNHDLSCDRLTFEAGTLNTLGHSVETDYWNSIDENPKQFNFSSSHITVNGEMALSRNFNSNVTVNAGTSLIECEDLTSAWTDLYDVKLINGSSRLLENYPYRFNQLILAGTGEVRTQNSLTVNDLVFETDGSTLLLDLLGADEFNVNGSIESLASSSNPGTLKSALDGTQKQISQEESGNICVSGPVVFQDIEVMIAGNFHAPDGIDGGGNNNINFSEGGNSGDLYWIAGGGNIEVASNWSKVSGGCPAGLDPESAPRLYFNNFGFFDDEIVSVNTFATNGEIYLTNSVHSVVFDIVTSLSASLLDVSNGDVSMTGSNLIVTETKLQNGGFLSSGMQNFTTDRLDTDSGLFIVRSGSNVTVNN